MDDQTLEHEAAIAELDPPAGTQPTAGFIYAKSIVLELDDDDDALDSADESGAADDDDACDDPDDVPGAPG